MRQAKEKKKEEMIDTITCTTKRKKETNKIKVWYIVKDPLPQSSSVFKTVIPFIELNGHEPNNKLPPCNRAAPLEKRKEKNPSTILAGAEPVEGVRLVAQEEKYMSRPHNTSVLTPNGLC